MFKSRLESKKSYKKYMKIPANKKNIVLFNVRPNCELCFRKQSYCSTDLDFISLFSSERVLSISEVYTSIYFVDIG